jgi:hypothetical protein
MSAVTTNKSIRRVIRKADEAIVEADSHLRAYEGPQPIDRVFWTVNTYDAVAKGPGVRLYIDLDAFDKMGDVHLSSELAEKIGQRLIAAAKEVRIAQAKKAGGTPAPHQATGGVA